MRIGLLCPLRHWSVRSGHDWIRAQFRRGRSTIYSSGVPVAERPLLEAAMRRRLSMEALGCAADAFRADSKEARDIKDAVAFASEVYPGYRQLDAWKELIAGTGIGTFERVEIQLGRYRRNFGERLRWQRWRRLGV